MTVSPIWSSASISAAVSSSPLAIFKAASWKASQRTVAARERQRRCFADVADAERVDETVERDLAPCLDCVEQVA